MSLLIVAALLAIAYLLNEAGLTFIALIAFLVAILHAVTSNRRTHAGAGHGAASGPAKQRPVIVTTTGGDIHNPMKIAIKHTWDGSDAYSDFLFYLSGAISWPFRIASRIITGQPGRVAKGGH